MARGTILVTGAAGGVGRVLVQQLLARGYGVIGSVLDQTELDDAKAAGLSAAHLFIADMAAADNGSRQLRDALASAGAPLLAAIGCAGVNPCGPLETTPVSVFRRAVEINATGNLAVYQAALPYLRQSGGRFIFVSSLSGKMAMPLLGYYTASKFALEGLADAMRLEAGQWGIPVSLIEPGAVATNMTHGFGRQLDARLSELDEKGRQNYGDYFQQQKAFAESVGDIALTAEAVATTIVEVLESEDPEARYPIGSAVDFIERRRLSTDREMDAMLNQFLPGKRTAATA
jgi:NAD(P)-dependent dehydrogenase (short-subunit alcohol dehydrogenase family)